jgi:multiple sugar transport system substrate-binding protein
VADSAAFKALPMRAALTEITQTGVGMPGNVPTQRAIELLIGEDVANVMISGEPVAEVQDSVEKRVNKALKKARR